MEATVSWQQAIDRSVSALGYELVDAERSAGGLLRVTIDRVPGKRYESGAGDAVTVDDCERVTRQLQYALEVDGIQYARLEVSSPGLDRPLKRLEDYARFAGKKASVRLKLPVDGRRRYEGLLCGVEDGKAVLEVEGKRVGFAFADIDRARLVPDV